MRNYTEWLALEDKRWSIRDALRADVETLKNVYKETREEGPAATVAAFVAAVGYSRAVAAVGTVVNRHAWDGRISRAVAAWAEALPDTWDEDAARHFNIYIDDIIHLAHFDQIAREIKKTTPPEDPDKRPETISADAAPDPAPETVAQVEPEKAPETVAMAPEAFRAVVESAPRCGLLFDLQGDCLRYKTEDGRKRCIFTEAVTVEYGDKMARIKYRSGSSRGQITLEADHACFPVAAVVAGNVSPSDALRKIEKNLSACRSVAEADAAYFRCRKKTGKRAEEMKEDIKHAATWADQAACIIKNAADGIPLFIGQIAAELEAVAVAANETGLAAAPAKHLEAVAAWIRETVAACWKSWKETAAQRPETISTGNHAAQVEPEKKPEGGRKYAAYYEDFPYTPRIFTAKNRKEADADARRYRRAWSLPAMLRLEALTDEEAAKLEAKEAARWNIPKREEAAPDPAPEAVAQVEPEKAPETVILIETTYDMQNGSQSSRRIIYSPETGTTEAAPEAVAQVEPEKATEAVAQVEPEKATETVAQVEPEPEARPARQAPEKPARGSGKPLDFIGQVLSGNGWQIVFDTGLQRTRVIIEEAAREKAAPLAEAAGFYYSVNTDSWHKKLSHKAHRAAEALAEKLRAAC